MTRILAILLLLAATAQAQSLSFGVHGELGLTSITVPRALTNEMQTVRIVREWREIETSSNTFSWAAVTNIMSEFSQGVTTYNLCIKQEHPSWYTTLADYTNGWRNLMVALTNFPPIATNSSRIIVSLWNEPDGYSGGNYVNIPTNFPNYTQAVGVTNAVRMVAAVSAPVLRAAGFRVAGPVFTAPILWGWFGAGDDYWNHVDCVDFHDYSLDSTHPEASDAGLWNTTHAQRMASLATASGGKPLLVSELGCATETVGTSNEWMAAWVAEFKRHNGQHVTPHNFLNGGGAVSGWAGYGNASPDSAQPRLYKTVYFRGLVKRLTGWSYQTNYLAGNTRTYQFTNSTGSMTMEWVPTGLSTNVRAGAVDLAGLTYGGSLTNMPSFFIGWAGQVEP